MMGSVYAAEPIDPKESGPFEEGRLVYQKTTSIPIDFVITDLKTGCQYMKTNSNSSPAVLLGCSPEYIDPKFKKN